MVLNSEEEPESRVELVRKGILPYRNRLETVAVAARLASGNGDSLVAITAIESIFDYRPEWFKIHGPTPPPWRTASTDVGRPARARAKAGNRRPACASMSAAGRASARIVGKRSARRVGSA